MDSRRTTTPAAAVAVAAMGVLALAGCTGPPEPTLAVLDQPATSANTLPDLGEHMEYEPARLVGEVDDGQVYAGRDREDQWCVIVVLDPEGKLAGASCADSEHFARRGVWVRTGGGGESAEAMLLPDDFAGELEEGWEIVEPNLAVPTS